MYSSSLICFAIVWLLTFFLRPFNKGLPFALVFIGVVIQYAYAVSFYLIESQRPSIFFSGSDPIFFAIITVLFFSILALHGAHCPTRKTFFVNQQSALPFRFWFGLFILSLIGSFWIIYSQGLYDFQNRLSSRRGLGFIFIFGYAGLMLCFAMAAGLVGKTLWFRILLSVPSLLFFIFAGYRSITMIVVVCVFLPYFMRSIKISRIKAAFLFALLVAVANPVNFITGSIRSVYSQGKDINLLLVAERASDLASGQEVPLANSHLQMLAGYSQRAIPLDLFFGTYQTIIPSLLNFLPRIIFPEKGTTTGVYLASIYFPEWFSSSGHESSLTSGWFLEVVINFGYILASFIIYCLFYGLKVFYFWLQRLGPQFMVLSIYIAWAVGFNGFFDDLGGVINKLSIGFLIFLFSYLGSRFPSSI